MVQAAGKLESAINGSFSTYTKPIWLPHADIDVIRTGGPAVTEDVLGELVVSTRVLGTIEIMLINHL